MSTPTSLDSMIIELAFLCEGNAHFQRLVAAAVQRTGIEAAAIPLGRLTKIINACGVAYDAHITVTGHRHFRVGEKEEVLKFAESLLSEGEGIS